MFKDKHILKKLLLVDIVVVSYILLTSSILRFQSERKVSEVVVSSIMEWSQKNFEAHDKVLERERTLTRTGDPELIRRLAGSVLLQVESVGEAWYLNPGDGMRYYLGKSRDAFLTMKAFALPVDGKDLLAYQYFDKAFPAALAGRFVYSTEKPNEYYYVDPRDKTGYPLLHPDDSFQTLVSRGIGIKNELIRKVPVGELPK